jgi:peptidylprolyl isomerase
MDVVETGDWVTIHFTLTFKDGHIYTTTRNKDPIKFKVGDNHVLPGIETAVLGMMEGQHKRLSLSPEEAFGAHDESLVLEFPRSDVPDHIQCKLGQSIEITQESSPPFRGIITHVDTEKIAIDSNLPMSGQKMELSIEIVNIS